MCAEAPTPNVCRGTTGKDRKSKRASNVHISRKDDFQTEASFSPLTLGASLSCVSVDDADMGDSVVAALGWRTSDRGRDDPEL